MTRRTAKRPAVRVRWEFSDTPYTVLRCKRFQKNLLPFCKLIELWADVTFHNDLEHMGNFLIISVFEHCCHTPFLNVLPL